MNLVTSFPQTITETPITPRPVLKVLGLGGGGSNAVARMIELGLRGIDFIAANTDHQTLALNPAPTKIQLGPQVTRGLGAGGNPRVGEAAARESSQEIAQALAGADMVFLTAGMGGGTGTGAIPVAAEIARSLGAVTIAIVTTPFSFEMGRRQKNANDGLALLRQHTHTLVSIPNDRLLYVAPRKLPMETAFRLADDLLRQAVQGISELITEPGMINIDFAHIRRMIMLGGGALMSIGHGQGAHKVKDALDQALHHPLLETACISNAAGIIANFTAGNDLSFAEVHEALQRLQDEAGCQAEIVMGVIQDGRMHDRAQLILMVTGLGAPTLEETMSSLGRTTASEKAAIPEETLAAPVAQPRHSETLSGLPEEALQPEAAMDVSAADHNFDLPAFLRRRGKF